MLAAVPSHKHVLRWLPMVIDTVWQEKAPLER